MGTKTTENYAWCIAYIDNSKVHILERDLKKSNQFSGIDVYLPTVRILKKQSKGKEIFNDVPLLLNYGFFKISLSWAMNQDLMQRLKDEITCISHWVKDPAKTPGLRSGIFKKKNKKKLRRAKVFSDKDVNIATCTQRDIDILIKVAKDESIYSSEEVSKMTKGTIITLMGYPFDGMEAVIIEVDKKRKKIWVTINLAFKNENEIGQLIEVSFDNVFYTIYKGSYDENYNEETLLEDYQSKNIRNPDTEQ